jgi:hypothetical protein
MKEREGNSKSGAVKMDEGQDSGSRLESGQTGLVEVADDDVTSEDGDSIGGSLTNQIESAQVLQLRERMWKERLAFMTAIGVLSSVVTVVSYLHAMHAF